MGFALAGDYTLVIATATRNMPDVNVFQWTLFESTRVMPSGQSLSIKPETLTCQRVPHPSLARLCICMSYTTTVMDVGCLGGRVNTLPVGTE